MNSYRPIIAVFALGLLLGFSGMFDRVEPQVAKAEPVQAYPALPSPSSPPTMLIPPAPSADETRRMEFERMAAAYAQQNGGISLNELQALSGIANGNPYESYYSQPYSPASGRRPIMPYEPPLLIQPGDTAPMTYGGEEAARYRGSMGTRYQYDLSNPSDQVRYSVDIQAQMRDQLSVDPRVELDRQMGQYGGGIDPN